MVSPPAEAEGSDDVFFVSLRKLVLGKVPSGTLSRKERRRGVEQNF